MLGDGIIKGGDASLSPPYAIYILNKNTFCRVKGLCFPALRYLYFELKHIMLGERIM